MKIASHITRATITPPDPSKVPKWAPTSYRIPNGRYYVDGEPYIAMSPAFLISADRYSTWYYMDILNPDESISRVTYFIPSNIVGEVTSGRMRFNIFTHTVDNEFVADKGEWEINEDGLVRVTRPDPFFDWNKKSSRRRGIKGRFSGMFKRRSARKGASTESRNGKRRVPASELPVGPDGFVPFDALVERDMGRNPRARAMDSMKVARTVRPRQLTPEQAVGWWNAPGRSDIAGVDAPADTPVTWNPRMGRQGKSKGNGKGKGKGKSAGSTKTTRYHPINAENLAEALRIMGRGDTPEDFLAQYFSDVDAVYADAEKAIAKGADRTAMTTLADSYSQGIAQYFDVVFRNIVKHNEAGHRDVWSPDRDPGLTKTKADLKKLRQDIASLAASPAPKQAPKPKGRKPKVGIPPGKGDLVIYGKRKGEKKYKGFDGEGLTNRRIYYMHYPPDKAQEVAEMVAEMNAMNPDYEFKLGRSDGTLFLDGMGAEGSRNRGWRGRR